MHPPQAWGGGGLKILEKSLLGPQKLKSRYSSFCIFNHPIIYEICDFMMSIST